MRIPIFNSIYPPGIKPIKSKKLDFSTINNLNFENIDIIKFPVVKILNKLPNKDSLFETIIVTANDNLVKMFLNKEISFLDISKILLRILKNKEFLKFKKIIPKNVDEITKLSNYVSLKINTMDI
tara:strand:- start:435 stop:809 length:375 start_codon:yes stop_codon:yes gene_type:complete